MIGLLCRTPQKESRHELLRRVAAGGGAFKGENGTKVHIPGANLNDIANQADDLLEVNSRRRQSLLNFFNFEGLCMQVHIPGANIVHGRIASNVSLSLSLIRYPLHNALHK